MFVRAVILGILVLGIFACTKSNPVSEESVPNKVTLDRPYKAGTPGEIPIRLWEISPDFYIATGRGCVSLVVDTSDGLVLVDTKLMYPATFKELKENTLKKTGKDRFTTVFMTHHHANHTGGNLFALEEGADLIGHETASVILDTYKTKIAPINPAKPTITFSDTYKMQAGDKRIEAYYWGPAHTNGDIAVYFPDQKIVAAGDLIDGSGGIAVDIVDGKGSLIGSLHRVDDLLELDFEILIPGHGYNVLTRDEVIVYRNRLASLIDRGKNAIRNDVKVGQLRDAMQSDDLGFRLAGHFWTSEKHIQTIFNELTNAVANQSD